MVRSRLWKLWGMVSAGLVVGLALGRMPSAYTLPGGASHSQSTAIPALGQFKLQALASHGADTFAIATGPVDDEVEGLFTLDYLTGDLQCFVINPRTFARGGLFKTNIAKDLAPAKGKKPTYLIATGRITPAGGAEGPLRPAGCICYVVDANTGEAVAYSFPWARGGGGAAQAAEMKLIGKWKARSLEIRD